MKRIYMAIALASALLAGITIWFASPAFGILPILIGAALASALYVSHFYTLIDLNEHLKAAQYQRAVDDIKQRQRQHAGIV